MSDSVVIACDQLSRPQPGGIGSYVRGLLAGLHECAPATTIDALVASGHESLPPYVSQVSTHLGPRALTEVWRRSSWGVPRDASVVHATSFAGPFAGGRQGAVHTATIHDVVWRDAPELLTPRGAQFHESRLTLLRNREDIHLMVPSPPLVERLVADGFAPERIHQFSLGVDSAVEALSVDAVRNVLLGHGVMGPFTLFVGTTEPRKNLARLAAAHQAAFKENPELGPLVIVGPSGWGEQHVDQAVSLGVVAPALLRGLYRDASVVTLPSLAEGWGLPAVEALREGTPVLASTAIPSVAESTEVVRVDPLDEAAIAVGLLEALNLPTDEASRRRRTLSVAHLTWAAAARVHLDVWEMLQGK